MVSRLRLVIAICAVMQGCVAAFAEFPSSYSTKYITIDDGLGRNYIDHIHRDSHGFIWLSLGGGGLVRYDGHSMLTFSESSFSRHIPCDFVRNVAEDAHRRLWVATTNGLAVISLETMRPIPLRKISPKITHLGEQGISSACADLQGNIWIGAHGVAHCLQFNEGGDFASVSSIDTHNPHEYLVFNEIGNQVWSYFNGNIYALTPPADKEGRQTLTYKKIDAAIPANAIVHTMIEKGEDVWIATTVGLVRYNLASKQTKTYTCVESNPATLSQNFITDLAIAPDNRLIASTLCGYNIYNAITDDFTRITQSADGLNSPFINCMLVDGPNVWIGTESGGVNLLTLKGIDCDFYPTSHPVNAIYTDPMGTVWVGCVENGLYALDQSSGKLQLIADASNSLPHNSVSAITMDSSGRLWVGTWGGGIALISPKNPKVSMMQISTLAGHPRHYIGAIAYDNINDGIWIGANSGIFYYDCKNGRTISPIDDSIDTAFGPIGAVIDDEGHLWMGCNQGLYDIDLHSRSGDKWDFRFLNKMLSSPNSETKENISFVALGPEKSLWIGSDTHGLYRRTVDASGEHFENFSTEHGLAHNAVKGIAFDSRTIWASTYKGLTSISSSDFSTSTYLKGNGLPDDSFYWNAASYSPESGVYFGTLTGLVSIKSDGRQLASSRAPIFTSLLVDNSQNVDEFVDADISVAREVNLHERNRSFSVTFSALDFSSRPSSQYLYMLEGFDKEWIALPEGRNDASYTSIAPGNYTLKVKYGTNGEVSVLPIHVKPYFYNTLWFMFLLMLAIAFSAWLFMRLRTKKLLSQKAELARLVDERTHEISEQKQRLEEQTRQMQQFTVERLSFFTSLTHEFRTPITLVLGPIEHAIKLSDNPKVQDQLHMAFRNAQYLMSLVNQLMDFRKIESGKMEIHRSKGDFREFVEDVAKSFRAVLDKRNIKLDTYFHLSNSELYFDKEAMRKLLHNFLSNASKYTPDGGTISVYAADVRVDGRPTLYVNVKDTGDGIDPKDIDRVFDKFYQGKSAMKYPSPMGSSGLGLHLCKSIVEAYGGTLKAKNNHGRGCSFRMLLPLADEPRSRKDTSQAHPECPQADMPTMLIVEDNPDMRAYLRGILSERFRVVEACDGAQALEMLQTPDIDFIISDLMMPGMDGLTFVRKLRENFETSHIPVLILTAKTAKAAQLESFRNGVDGYLTKPFDEEMLLARIDAIIDNRRRRNSKILSTFEEGAVPEKDIQAEVEDTPDARFIKQVMETIESNYRNSYYEVGDFADNLGVSRTVLNKKLQSLLGKSANKFIRDYRLKVALELIKRHRQGHAMNISEIAYDVGFNDSKYFTRCFTKHYGVPPSSVMQGVDPKNPVD